jgi:hypothetical protein
MAELVDRYPITWRPVRDLLVRYLEERASAMDYAIKLAENVQQQLNDTFVHTTWPACPLHPQHRSGSTRARPCCLALHTGRVDIAPLAR